MRPRRITSDQLARAYELLTNGATYEQAGKAIRAERAYLNTLVKRAEREGLGFLRQRRTDGFGGADAK
jgi:hypothetical protein